MTNYGDAPPEVPDEYWDDEEPPYPEGTKLSPLVIGVLIILTVMSWWLAYNAPSFLSGLLFGAAPIGLWCVGLRIIRGSKKRAEEIDREWLIRRMESPSPDAPHHLRKYMLPGERMLFYTHRHPITMLGKKRPWVGGVVLLLGVATVAALLREGQPVVAAWLFLAGALILAVRWLFWRDEWFWETNIRFMRKHGMIRTRTAMVPNDKITDLELVTPWSASALAWLRLIRVPWGHILIQAADTIEGDQEQGKAKGKSKSKPANAGKGKRLRRRKKKAKPPSKRKLKRVKRKPMPAIRHVPSAASIALVMNTARSTWVPDED